jgi:hypothetical protein
MTPPEGQIFSLAQMRNERLDRENVVYDTPELTPNIWLTNLLDTLEENGGDGYAIVCDFQDKLVKGYPEKDALHESIQQAQDAIRELGVA